VFFFAACPVRCVLCARHLLLHSAYCYFACLPLLIIEVEAAADSQLGIRVAGEEDNQRDSQVPGQW